MPPDSISNSTTYPAEPKGTMSSLRNGLSGSALRHMASRAGVKAVVLTHLTLRPGSDDYTSWGEEVKKYFSGHVHIARDLMEF